MESQNFWAGLDFGLTETHVCLVDDAGTPVHEQTCKSHPREISDALSAVPQSKIRLVAAEASAAPYVMRKLREANFPVAIFDPAKASKFLGIRRNKTDAHDARGLADLARLGRQSIAQVFLKSLDCQQLRSELTIRSKLVRLRVVADGALRMRLAVYGRKFVWPRNPALIRERVLAEVASLKAEHGIDLGDSLAALIDVCINLRTYQQKLDRQFENFAAGHPICSRLMEVTGVGPICAVSFYTAIQDPARFDRQRDLAAYLGLAPRWYQSGGASYSKGVPHGGKWMTRTHLYTAAVSFRTRGPESELKDWAGSLRARVGGRRANIAVARKLAIILLTMWKNDVPFEPYPSKQMGEVQKTR